MNDHESITGYNNWRNLDNDELPQIDDEACNSISKHWDCPEDVPGPVCWLRYTKDGTNSSANLVLWIDQVNLRIFHTRLTWKQLSDGWEHSTDRKTWLPCTKTNS